MASSAAPSAIFEGLFDAAGHMEMMRFPELFCGFPAPPRHRAGALSGGLRAAGLGQRGAVRAAAGLSGHWSCDFAKREIRFHNPQLPKFLEEIRINDLELAGASVNLRLRRRGAHTEVAIVSQRATSRSRSRNREVAGASVVSPLAARLRQLFKLAALAKKS